MPWSLKEISGRAEYESILKEKGRSACIGLFWKVPNGVVVSMPPGSYTFFNPYQKSSGGGGWTVQGEWPNVTVTPSINCVGVYHGYIQNGQITEDCDGRKF